jgi:hypothetical protein
MVRMRSRSWSRIRVDFSADVLGFTELFYLHIHRYIERQAKLQTTMRRNT